ncbi:MAG: hypothetical protein E6G49_04700 [Actinobacteria bacterium]|nr:MAG: hypothetical protein E6G49_04700 [Actinomycetota bacterium]
MTALILAFLFMALSAGASNAATMLYPNLKTLPPRRPTLSRLTQRERELVALRFGGGLTGP